MTYATQLRAAQRQYENASPDEDDEREASEAFDLRWLTPDLRRTMRIEKGRQPFPTYVRQYDAGLGRLRRELTIRPDPILDLYVARENSLRSQSSAARYAELRARVMQPVVLPKPKAAPRIDPIFYDMFRRMGLAA